jgi:hypothetical protein
MAIKVHSKEADAPLMNEYSNGSGVHIILSPSVRAVLHAQGVMNFNDYIYRTYARIPISTALSVPVSPKVWHDGGGD